MPPLLLYGSRCFLLLGLAIAWGALSEPGLSAFVSQQPVHLYPTTPRQGDTLFLRFVPRREDATVRCTWDGRAVPLDHQGHLVTATIAIRITERPGVHSLKLKSWDERGEPEVEERNVTVRKTNWPIQYLRMSRSTERLYTFPGAREEDAAVTAATRTFSNRTLWQGSFLVPVNRGRQSTPFGVKRIRNGRRPYYHRGLDLAAPVGTPIYAPNAGRVALAQDFRKYGKTIVLDHGLGVTSLYLHMSALEVSKDAVVERGQRIGRVGAEGVATGPHLHWSVYVHGDAVNPRFWTQLPDSLARQ